MEDRLFFPATKKNRLCIGDKLSKFLEKKGTILELGSGSGEHGVSFQKRFPSIIWQTSDPEMIYRKSISAWINYEELNHKMPQPLTISVEKTPWEIPYELSISLQGIISINMIHVASWNCTRSLFKESSKLLKNRKFLILYGPFKIDNKHTSQSNQFFDMTLKLQNNTFGVRNLDDVSREANNNNFIQEDIIKMPANNLMVVYRKAS